MVLALLLLPVGVAPVVVVLSPTPPLPNVRPAEAAKLDALAVPLAPLPLPVLNTEPGREAPEGAVVAAVAPAVRDEALVVPGVPNSGIIYHRKPVCMQK